MNTKMPSAIEKIMLNAATFSGVEVKPTLINFFYGNNGTGKSTIARTIHEGAGLSWCEGKSAADYAILVYNQEFIEMNFRSYGDLKGVFTVGEENIEIQEQVVEKKRAWTDLQSKIADKKVTKERNEAARASLLGTFQEDCWNRTKAVREGFESTQGGYKRKAQFAERVLQISSPEQHDIGTLRVLHETAFDPDATVYREFRQTGRTTRLKGSRGNELLGNPISSSGDSPFASFIKALRATDWVRQGHNLFTETAEGKCPYCQQTLPADFESQLAACFDAQYQEDIDALRQFHAAYAQDMNGFIEAFKANLNNPYPKLDLSAYRDKLALLEALVQKNLQIIADKIKEPSAVFALDNEGVKTLREELNEIIAAFNQQIQENNAVVNAKQQKQAECKTKVWELIAFELQSEIESYATSRKNLDDELNALQKEAADISSASRALETEIAELNKRIRSTAHAIKNINDLLRDSGFQGFTLREKRGQQNVYEVVRQDGQVASKLSEGERNFIAFLYFYQLVRGSHDESDLSKDRIVVIDDPVSSMDSSVLFIVGALVREMVEVCHNNASYLDEQIQGDYIKQLFVLTHNVFFHREITYNQAHRYRCVSFFVVSKASNVSSVRCCVRQSQKIPTENENFNPVQNSYAALWSEYREVETVIPTMNVIRRILEYYFMQLCGYDGVDIRKRVLEDNRDRFVESVLDGQPDYTKYHLASSMLSYIATSSTGISDGLNFVDECVDVLRHKEVFRLIFEALQQEQHYSMMMGEA